MLVVPLAEISLACNQKSEATTASTMVDLVVVMTTTVPNGPLQPRTVFDSGNRGATTFDISSKITVNPKVHHKQP